MGRFSKSSSYNHHIQNTGWGYRLSWVVDCYSAGSRLRNPSRRTRDTDIVGAEKFAKKWGIAMPPASTTREN